MSYITKMITSLFLSVLIVGCTNTPSPQKNAYSKSSAAILKSNNIQLAKKELMIIANAIYINETGGVRDNLVFWNPNEPFPSLGIGHFIWYPKGSSSNSGDMLPSLISFYQQHNRQVPDVLKSRYAPWKNRSELEQARANGELEEVISFFENTKDVQIVFIYQRLISSIDKMVASSSKPDHIKTQFSRIMKTRNGLYPLIDYVNFKGEGTAPIKSYNNISWGLQQVLESMSGTSIGKSALTDFSNGCKQVLTNRVKNQPSNKNDGIFLDGWKKRCDTYRNALTML